jgi:hypothetical protein
MRKCQYLPAFAVDHGHGNRVGDGADQPEGETPPQLAVGMQRLLALL